MSIVQTDHRTSTPYTFPVYYDAPHVGPMEGLLQLGHWPAEIGETHQLGGPKGREIICQVEFADAYSTQSNLQAIIDAVSRAAFLLHGLLTINNVDFPNCTFLGYEETDRFLEGSGIRGWISQGRLRWRQALLPEAPPPPDPEED